jgi:hypothetical protein
MAFNPGKDNGERKKLRAIVSDPRSPQIQRERAQDILNLTGIDNSDDFDDGADDIANITAVEQLLDQATGFLGRFETEQARVCVDEALKLATTLELRSAVLDIAAQILISDRVPPEQVIAILKESETLTPLTSHERLLDLAQFCTSEESLGHYQNAIKLIEAEVGLLTEEFNAIPKGRQYAQEREDCQFEIDDLASVAATAMVAISELYTTDLCDDDNAEQQCGHYLQLAMKTDPMSVEAFRAYGNYCYIRYDSKQPITNAANQHLLQEAIKASKQAYIILRQCYEQGLDSKIPEFTPRLELGRQLYELQCWEETLTVLTMILQEELEVAEIWLLCVISSYKLAEQLHIEMTTLQNQTNTQKQIGNKKMVNDRANKMKNLQEQIHSLLSCAAQYCVNAGRVLEAAEDKDADIISQLKQYVALLKERGYSLAQAKKELAGDDGEYDESLLDGIDSDSDDDDDDGNDGNDGNDGMGE